MDANGNPLASQLTGVARNDGGNSAAPSRNADAKSNPKMRKRTKTGCLTCRRRRIKCGEEKPICHNCTKSKRACEGYNQRVIWKNPPDWHAGPDDGTTLPYHNGMLPPPPGQYPRPIPPPIDTGSYMPGRMQDGRPIAINERGEPIYSPPSAGFPYPQTVNGMPIQSPHTPQVSMWTPVTPQYGHPLYSQSPMSTGSAPPLHPQMHMSAQQGTMTASSQFEINPSFDHTWSSHTRPADHNIPTPISSIPQDLNRAFYDESSGQAIDPNSGIQMNLQQVDGPICLWEPPTSLAAPMGSVSETSWAQANGAEVASSHSPNVSVSITTSSTPVAPTPQPAKFMGHNVTGMTAQFLEDAATEYHDDDYYDVQSDDDMDITPEATLLQLQQENKDLRLIHTLHQEHLSELTSRRYDTFLYNGMLDEYRPEEHANPLRNRATARVFAHFIFATGPSLSIFERHPRNPSAMFTDGTREYQKGLWTYTLPMMAIKHQGLLHAMLALSSLHISKLQGTENTPSFKHYAYAIKRIHKSVGIASKKLLPTTVAATLLLGFYEVLTADHLKWSSHLAGARQLLREIPFKRMTREARRLKAQQVAQKDQFGLYDGGFNVFGDQGFRDMSPALDESLLSILMGKQLKYDQYGEVYEDSDDEISSKHSPPFDPAKYELYQDLYWWYARQDAYQAILSGNKLLLDFSRWTDCPPRASMGRSDAIYGTHDHLVILIARIADFNARDRKRKIKVMEANGGQWRPPGAMRGGPPPQTARSSSSNNPNGAFTKAEPGVGNTARPHDQYPANQNHINGGRRASNARDTSSHLGFQPPSGLPGDLAAEAYFKKPAYATLTNNVQASSTQMGVNYGQVSPNAPFTHPGAMPSAQGFVQPRRPSVPGPPPSAPTFYGMAPLPTKVNMPSSYRTNAESTPSPKSDRSDYDIEAATQSALKEWSELKAALTTFESHLGAHYQPLPADTHVPSMTPFGPAVFYRSHDVAVIWALYYMACIIAQRCHPHMPPAALMAAGVAATQTVQYSTRIGQVVGGIVPPTIGPDLSPVLGACLCEVALPLFFAGIQYQSPEQRVWLISLLRSIELQTGWKSVGMVAQGCETSWMKAAEMGRGPAYERTAKTWHAYNIEKAMSPESDVTPKHEQPDLEDRDWNKAGARVHWAMGLLSMEENDDESKSLHVSGIQPSRTKME